MVEKFKCLEDELNESQNHLKKFYNDNLVQILNDQMCYYEKFGLGFDKSAASSSHVASTSRVVFVKPEIFEPHVACLDKCKNVIVYEHVKVESEILVKKQSKFIPTCFHCGIIGHTWLYGLQICSQRPWTKKHDPKKGKAGKKSSMPKYAPRKTFCEHKHDSSYFNVSYGGLFNMMRDVLTRLVSWQRPKHFI